MVPVAIIRGDCYYSPSVARVVKKEVEVGKGQCQCIVAAVYLWAGWSVAARADSFTTNIISGVTTNTGTTYILGNTGSSNYLEIEGGGALFSREAWFGGGSLAASNNSALVTGSNSTWASALDIDFNSAGNSLVVSNGGALGSSTTSYIGSGPGADNNLVVLTGTGSVWNDGSLWIGYFGAGNELQVLNGAQVSGNGSLSIGSEVSSNSALIITGPNSSLMNSGSIFMGDYGPGQGSGGLSNQLVLGGGASLICAGMQVSGTGNVITVTGSNTAWIINGEFDLAQIGPGIGNQLTINAGAVVSNTTFSCGGDDTSADSTVVVDGPGTVWYNHAFFFGSSSNNTLLVTNGATIYTSQIVDIGDGVGANNNLVAVTGTNTVWSNSGSLMIGHYDGVGNELEVLNGAQMVGNTAIWLDEGISNSSLMVSGPNSLLTSSGSLYMGAGGPGNQLTLSNGATFICSSAVVANSNNTVLVTGSNTVWNNTGTLAFGYCCGNSNQLLISAGAAVSNGDCTISTTNNLILIDETARRGTRVRSTWATVVPGTCSWSPMAPPSIVWAFRLATCRWGTIIK